MVMPTGLDSLSSKIVLAQITPSSITYDQVSANTDPAVTAHLNGIGPQRGFNKGFDAS